MDEQKRLQNTRTLKQVTAATPQDKFILDFPLFIADGMSGSETKAEQSNMNTLFLLLPVGVRKRGGVS